MVKLAGALVALILSASPASAGEAFDNAVVAMTSMASCPDPIFSDGEAAALAVIAGMTGRDRINRVFVEVVEASSLLNTEIIRRGTAVPFCIEARRLAATMPRT